MTDMRYVEILDKLDVISKLLAAQLIENKEYRDQVYLLNSIGLQPKLIAALTGKTVNNVNVTLHLIKKKKRKRNKS